MGTIAVLDRPKATRKPICSVSSASLLRSYEARRAEESVETKIRELEMQFDRYIQVTLRSLLGSKEIEDITALSTTSLQNIVTIQRLAKQIQEANTEG